MNGRVDRSRPGTGIPRRLALAVAALALAFAMFHWALPFVGAQTLGNDYVTFAIQQQLEGQYALAHGEFPLFAPGFAGGHSAWAMTMGQIFHPLAHLAAHSPGYWNGLALDWNTFWRVLSLAVCQLLLYRLGRRLGLKPVASFLVSLLVVYNLRMLDQFRYGAGLESYTGMLVLVSALFHLWDGGDRRIALAATALGSYLTITSGHPQMAYFGLIGGGLFMLLIPHASAAIRGHGAGPAWRSCLRYYALGMGGMLLGLALAAPYAIPYYDEFVATNLTRAQAGYAWSLEGMDNWRGVFAAFFDPLLGDVQGNFGSHGVIAAALLLPLAWWQRDHRRPAIIAAWLTTILILLFALGDATPVHRLAWQLLPFFDAFRTPGRITVALVPALFILLAWFASAMERRQTRAGTIVVLLGALGAATLFRWGPMDWAPQPSVYAPLAIRSPASSTLESARILDLLGILLLLAYVLARQFGKRWASHVGIGLLAPATVASVALLLSLGTWTTDRQPSKTLDQYRAEKSVSPVFQGSSGAGVMHASVQRQTTLSSLDWRPAAFYTQWSTVPDNEQAYLALLRRASPRQAIVEAAATALPATTPDTEARRFTVRLAGAAYNRWVFEVDTGVPGLVVFNFPYLDGQWSAEVDGRPSGILRTNGNENGVPVAAGKHRVSFSWHSRTADFAVALALVTLTALGLWVALGARYRMLSVALALWVPMLLAAGWYITTRNADLYLPTRFAWSDAQEPPANTVSIKKRSYKSDPNAWANPMHAYAGNAADGNLVGRAAIASDWGAGAWWEIDLGQVIDIQQIQLHRAAPAARKEVRVEVSTDRETYRLIGQGGGSPLTNPLYITLPGLQGRFLRVTAMTPGPLVLSEVLIFGEHTP